MPSVQYAHSAFCCTANVNCDILKYSGDEFQISFTDPYTQEIDVRWVQREELTFPPFGDLVM